VIDKPSSWLVVLYTVSPEPSKSKVRIWREFKKIGALYPQMSICLLPDNNETKKKVSSVSKIVKENGEIIILEGRGVLENDQDKILEKFRFERDKQYEEILEECQEFMDEIELNIKNKKISQEEVEEMEEVLEGLKTWLKKVQNIDWIESPPLSQKVEKLLARCNDSMDHFAELIHPK